MKRRLAGFLILVVAVAVAIYICGWLCFLEPIFYIIEAAKVGFTVKGLILAICKLLYLPMTIFCVLILYVTGHAMLLDK